MAYIDDRIAELEQRIAEKKAYQRMHSPHKYASTWDYVAEGDRSGYDRMDASEAAYRNMLAQQAQQNAILKAQQAFNARENELNRKNALEISRQNKAEQEQYKLDEYRRGRNKAASIMSSYKEALNKDPNNTQLNKEYNLAKEDYDYYDRKLGGQGYTEQIETNVPKESNNLYKGLSNDELLSIANSIHSKKVYSEEDKSKLDKLANATDDQKVKEQILTIKSNKGKTKEDKDTERLNKLQSLIDSGKNLNTKQRAEYNRLKSSK